MINNGPTLRTQGRKSLAIFTFLLAAFASSAIAEIPGDNILAPLNISLTQEFGGNNIGCTLAPNENGPDGRLNIEGTEYFINKSVWYRLPYYFSTDLGGYSFEIAFRGDRGLTIALYKGGPYCGLPDTTTPLATARSIDRSHWTSIFLSLPKSVRYECYYLQIAGITPVSVRVDPKQGFEGSFGVAVVPRSAGINTPDSGTSRVNELQQFKTSCGDPAGWRHISTIDLRLTKGIAEPPGQPSAMWVQFDENRRVFRLLDLDSGEWLEGTAGSPAILETSNAQLHLEQCQVAGSGPEGLGVDIDWAVSFKEPAVQHHYQQYLRITDDDGVSDGWIRTGEWSIDLRSNHD